MPALLSQVELNWSQWLAPFGKLWWAGTACSALVGIALGVLGCFVILRRMALIGDALSHAILPGVVIAFLLTGRSDIEGLFLGALVAGLVAAILIRLVSQYSRSKEDSAIGVVFTAFFALGVVIASMMPRSTHFDLKCFLFGDPLAVGREDVRATAIVAPIVLITIGLLYHRLKIVSFDPLVAAAMGISVSVLHYLLMGLLSVTVIVGLKTVGVILVVAMVITPASAAYQLTNRLFPMLLLAGLFGAISAAVGMSVAFVTNAPTGPAMVLVATFIFGLAVLFSPMNGVLVRLLRRRSVRVHTEVEDVLKAIYNLGEQGIVPTADTIASRALLSTRRVSAITGALQSQRLLEPGSVLALTDAGHERARELVRAHRLWESYLADHAQLDHDAIHHEAERLEHAHELADEVDATLGFPARDPHGEVIPSIAGGDPAVSPDKRK